MAGLRVPAAPGRQGDGSSTSATRSDTPDEDGIHQALLSGLLSHIGALEEREQGKPGERRPMREYLGARNARFAVFPGSVLKGRNPGFLMSAELVETSRLWARQNAAIKPEWAERLGAHLVKRTYSEPHWSRKRAAVMARERVTLYGVPLVADRLVQYGRIDAPLARELFIRHALVQGEWDSRHRFLAENARLLEEAEELEHRARRRDIVVDEETLFEFYDAPRRRRRGQRAALRPVVEAGPAEAGRPAHLRPGDADPRHRRPRCAQHDFPTQWHDSDEAGLTFPISYHFEPGAADDGLTIDVPVATLNRIDADDFSWLVPGLREELVTELIRSLPKNLRVAMVPAPNTAREFLAADAARRRAAARRPRALRPQHPQPGHRPRGVGLVEGADAPAADLPRGDRGGRRGRPRQGPRRAQGAAAADLRAGDGRRRVRLRRDGDRPDRVDLRHGRGVLRPAPRRSRGARLPGARRRGGDRRAAGARDRRRGRGAPPARRTPSRAARARLAPTPVDDVLAAAGLDQRAKLALVGSPYPSSATCSPTCAPAIVGEVVDARPTGAGRGGVRRRGGGCARRRRRAASSPAVHDVMRVLEAWRTTDKRDLRARRPDDAAGDDRHARPGRPADGAGLRRRRRASPGCATTRATSPRSPTAASGSTAQVAARPPAEDQLAGLQEAWLHAVAALPDGQPVPQHLRESRWLLEEYRVSLFAQQLGTREKVSDQRIRKVMGSVEPDRAEPMDADGLVRRIERGRGLRRDRTPRRRAARPCCGPASGWPTAAADSPDDADDAIGHRQRVEDLHRAGRPVARRRRGPGRSTPPPGEWLGDDLPLVANDVTIEHLLSHRSGIGDYLDEDSDVDLGDYPMPVSVHRLDHVEAYVPLLDGFPTKFPAGTDFSYCNGGFVILALVAERASGTPFTQLVHERVCVPAGLRATGYPRSDALPGDAALGYVEVDGQWRTNVFHLPGLRLGGRRCLHHGRRHARLLARPARRPHRLRLDRGGHAAPPVAPRRERVDVRPRSLARPR